MAITIISATYGTTTAGADVTALCQNMVNNGNDDITVNNTTMGGDPDPGVVKSFGIQYKLPNGLPGVRGCQEGQSVDLAP